MRSITENGLNLIKQFEGLSTNAYVCPAGYLTIGYGHLIKDFEKDKFKNGITEKLAEEYLRKDVIEAEDAVRRLITVPVSDNQFDALVSFTYNLGAGALQRSTLRFKVNRGEHNEAPREFMKWVWADGKKLQGLIVRRQAEANLYSKFT